MATIVVRGRRIRVQAKAGTQRLAVYTLYSTYTDERLDEREAESIEHEQVCCGDAKGEDAFGGSTDYN